MTSGKSYLLGFTPRLSRTALTLLAIFCVLPSLFGETVTFGQFAESSAGNDFTFLNSGSTAVLESRDPKSGSFSIPVTFTLLSLPGSNLPADLQGPQAAHLTFQIRTDQKANAFGNHFDQSLYSQDKYGAPQYGSIIITRNTPDNELHQTNFLTVSFYAVAGGLDGIRRGQTASLTADSGISEEGQSDYVQFKSSYLRFADDAQENLAFSFTSASPCLTLYTHVQQVRGGCSTTGQSTVDLLHSFTAAGTGSFASDPSAISDFATPEPSTWWIVLLGLSGIGFALRSKPSHEHLRPALASRHSSSDQT